MQTKFDQASLPLAIKALFELNHYEVTGPVHIHGAEVDLIAKPIGSPFAANVYIEATIAYVDSDKYGKDVGKLAMVRNLEPDAKLVIVSSQGFTLDVKERAAQTRIEACTYDELSAKFEHFHPYIESILTNGKHSAELQELQRVYEEPNFHDERGQELATTFLETWCKSLDNKNRWIIVLGEYGTGKTALTKILQYRWTNSYKFDPKLPLPFRIELRDFTRQFDARGLIHHFLDSNNLGHISLDFVMSLIRAGKIILILDGYDEMAQYLHARERRACLEALAELSADGAKGIITSRPNYFTENEELQVFEALYTSITQSQIFLGATGRALIEEEKRVDQLLLQFFERYERHLRDLTAEQTVALVDRVLVFDPVGRNSVQRILSRIFRIDNDGGTISLSGKPVIVTYLLEVVESLKDQGREYHEDNSPLTEWQAYKMIIDLLMLRDLKRSALVTAPDRRKFLQTLSILLSQKEKQVIEEEEFKDLVVKVFSTHFRRLGANRVEEQERLFADLRSSSTLTRTEGERRTGWRFSHNSLREYLLAEHLILSLKTGVIPKDVVPISDAMRTFVASIDKAELLLLLTRLSEAWGNRASTDTIGQLFTLLWDGFQNLPQNMSTGEEFWLTRLTGRPAALNRLKIANIRFATTAKSADLTSANFNSSELFDTSFTHCNISRCDFTEAVLENVNFTSTNLTGAKFVGATIIDADFTDATITGADFRHISKDYISILVAASRVNQVRIRHSGHAALGYLKFKGALVDEIPPQAYFCHFSCYTIVQKVLSQLAEQTLHQRRGIEQRGAAARDVPFARALVNRMIADGHLTVPRARRELLEITEQGRNALKRFCESGVMPISVQNLITNWK